MEKGEPPLLRHFGLDPESCRYDLGTAPGLVPQLTSKPTPGQKSLAISEKTSLAGKK